MLGPPLRADRIDAAADDERRRLHEWQLVGESVAAHRARCAGEAPRPPAEVVGGREEDEARRLANPVDPEPRRVSGEWVAVAARADQHETLHPRRLAKGELDGDLAPERAADKGRARRRGARERRRELADAAPR